jgi:hypothetical protein
MSSGDRGHTRPVARTSRVLMRCPWVVGYRSSSDTTPREMTLAMPEATLAGTVCPITVARQLSPDDDGWAVRGLSSTSPGGFSKQSDWHRRVVSTILASLLSKLREARNSRRWTRCFAPVPALLKT